MIWICLTREVETLFFPIRHQAPDVKHSEMVERHPDRILDVRYLEKMERRKGDCPRVHGVGTHPEQLHPDSPRGYAARSPIQTPSRRSTWHSLSSHPDDSISYPDMLSGWLTIVHKPCYVIPTAYPYSLHSGFGYGKGLQSFGSSCFWAFHCLAMDSKGLSSISDCFGDQITNKKHQNLHNLIRNDSKGP